jgi:hypothetical protein
MATGNTYPGDKMQSGCDTDHSPPSSVEIKNEQELHLLFTQSPSWHAVGQLYFLRAVTGCSDISNGRTGINRTARDL